MDAEDKNGGPIHLQAWRRRAGLSQTELAEKVGTNANMIGYLESGERGLSAKWLRRFAPVLNTTPGMLLDHNPDEISSDIMYLWKQASLHQQRQLTEIANTLLQNTQD